MATRTVPPFYANRDDNMSCALATYRSIIEHFSGKQLEWQELEKLTGYKHGGAAWTVTIWSELADQGYDIDMIEPFDYARYAAEGEEYLKEQLTPEEFEWQLKNSNILAIKPLIPRFLETVSYTKRSPVLKDIDQMLAEGRLVTVSLNARVLNNKDGYSSHVVLVYDKDNKGNYIAHDPGLPPVESRNITPDLLYKAMGGINNNQEIAGIKLK